MDKSNTRAHFGGVTFHFRLILFFIHLSFSSSSAGPDPVTRSPCQQGDTKVSFSLSLLKLCCITVVVINSQVAQINSSRKVKHSSTQKCVCVFFLIQITFSLCYKQTFVKMKYRSCWLFRQTLHESMRDARFMELVYVQLLSWIKWGWWIPNIHLHASLFQEHKKRKEKALEDMERTWKPPKDRSWKRKRKEKKSRLPVMSTSVRSHSSISRARQELTWGKSTQSEWWWWWSSSSLPDASAPAQQDLKDGWNNRAPRQPALQLLTAFLHLSSPHSCSTDAAGN